ncbi:MAG TPA: twin-arginine translocase subunit TatC [Nocardioidaceae bacterium]|nr:twin-arginine translocase subunit TatC [Nocardioidaceae bacterium]
MVSDSLEVVDEGGRMSLIEHLRELRNRLFKSVLAIIVGLVVGWIFYDQLFDLLQEPFASSVADLAEDRELNARLTLGGVATPFTLQVKIALVAGIVLASPVWLYQIWAFVAPGLHSSEKKYGLAFIAVSSPFFLAGIGLGYLVLPKSIEILISFTPGDVSNLVEVDGYLTFVLRMLLVFGIALEIPLFVVLLNLAGVVSAASLSRARAWIVLGVFVFAAIATPSTDPITMLFLAVPMTVLFLASEVIARLVDHRRARRSHEPDFDTLADEEQSDLQFPHDPDDDRPSRLDD